MQFGKLRSIFWPIHGHEIRWYLPIFFVTFLLGVDYHILRNLKYAMLVTAPGAGAEAIPFVQLWGLVPAALAMTFLLAKLGRRFTQAQVFYTTVTGFLAFFFLFTFVLYPYEQQLQPVAFCSFLRDHLPSALNGLVAIIQYWVFSVFYVVAELWKVSVLAVLFWGYVNSNIELKQAKRFYGPLMLASSLAGMVGGGVASLFSSIEFLKRMGLGRDHWMPLMMSVVIGFAILSMILFRWLERQSNKGQLADGKPKEAKKLSFSVGEAFRLFKGSRYLVSLGFIVVAEYVAFTLTELLWKDQLRILCPDKLAFCGYTGQVILWAMGFSILFSFTLSGSIINKIGWRRAAIVTPVVMLTLALAFYVVVLCQESSFMEEWTLSLFGITPLAFAVFLGAVHNCLTRVAKATLLDPTKELAFVPLPAATQVQGKALIDGVGTHAGRAGGALVQQILLFCFPTVLAGGPVSAAIVVAIILIWVRCVKYVGGRYRGMAAEPLEGKESLVVEEPLTNG